MTCIHHYGLPWWLSGKEPTCWCRRHGLNPWVGKIPEERNGNPLQYSCLEILMDRGAWWVIVHRVVKELDMTLRVNNHHHRFSIIQKSSVLLQFIPSPHPQSLTTTDLLTVSIVLPFQERYILGTTQYVVFSDWLFSLSTICLRFPPCLFIAW